MTLPPFSPDSDEAAIWAGILDVYAAAVAGDRARIDTNIHPDATLWDSEAVPLVHGLAELNVVRDARPPQEPGSESIDTASPEIRVWGDTGVLCHYFGVRDESGAVTIAVRNTSVWRRTALADGATRWLMVHNHEDVMATPWLPTE